MPSSYTASLRITLQATGENNNTWGNLLNSGTLQLLDSAIAGWTTKALTGDYTLTTADGAASEARSAMLKFTGTGTFTVTVPGVSKRYAVWNACTGTLTVTNGSVSVTVLSGEVVSIVTDGSTGLKRVVPQDMGGNRLQNVGAPSTNSDATTKLYVDNAITAAAFSLGTFGVPISSGDNGKFLTNNGSTPSWGYAVTAGAGLATVSTNTVTVSGSTATDVRGASSTGTAVTPGSLGGSAAWGGLTDASTIAWDIASKGYNATVTLTASGHQVGAPTLSGGALFDGCPVMLAVVQDGTGGRTVTWNTVWDFGAVLAPTLVSGAGKITIVSGVYWATTGKIHVNTVWRSA